MQPLPAGVRLTVVTDCCHSGTILDLPYVYKSHVTGLVKLTMIQRAKAIYSRKNERGLTSIFYDLMALFCFTAPEAEQEELVDKGAGIASESHKKGGRVVLITGCQDNQTSADATINNQASGALTFGLLKALRDHKSNLTYEELLLETRKCLQGKYTQVPQLCVGEELDIKSVKFTM